LAVLAAGRQVGRAGLIARGLVLAAIGLPLLIYPAAAEETGAALYAKAVVFAIIGLSLNILMGYAGQISLGHNAFVGVGAFAAGYLFTNSGVPMFISILLAMVIGGVTASFLGAVALRLQGLYLALVTLAYGLVAERSIFEIEPLTGGGAGTPLARPDPFASDNLFAYVCLAFLAAVLFLDWRMMKTKFGRALLALKSNEQVASSFGMNPVFYKLSAFVLAGSIAGLGGGLLGFSQELVVSQDFTFSIALTYVIMVVIGGLGSRIGVVIGSVFTAYLITILEGIGRFLDRPSMPEILQDFGGAMPLFRISLTALLLLVTITQFPGGVAQQLKPVITWLSGKPFPRHEKRHHVKEEAFAGTEDAQPGETGARGERE
jgi:branched-chain amino acid transport system permease protein